MVYHDKCGASQIPYTLNNDKKNLSANIRYKKPQMTDVSSCNPWMWNYSPEVTAKTNYFIWLVGWLCLTSHRHRGHSETAPQFTVPCEGRNVCWFADYQTFQTGSKRSITT